MDRVTERPMESGIDRRDPAGNGRGPVGIDRRRFLATLGGALAGTGALAATAGAHDPGEEERPPLDPDDWSSVRAQFAIADDVVDLAALYLATHPLPVRDAIAEHRRGLDRSPTLYLQDHDLPLTARTLDAAARYMDVDAGEIALTDSTTMGLGLLYGGLRLRPGDDVLTTAHDYYVTHESLRLAAGRTGAGVRRLALYDRTPVDLSPEAIVHQVARAIRPETRVVAVTWVHSGTGLKLPVAAIAEAVEEANEDRDEDDRILLCVDGVHGLGVEDETMGDLGCDFFASGAHKWVFGPRGTGVLWGRDEAWERLRPSIPSFLADEVWHAWARGGEPGGETTARRMTPGGFKPFEHRWALAEAFAFLSEIGKPRIAERTHALARQLKEALGAMDHVTLFTPMREDLSSGIVCFDVDRYSARVAVARLRNHGIVATVTPYAVTHVRLSPSIRNTAAEMDAAIRAVEALG